MMKKKLAPLNCLLRYLHTIIGVTSNAGHSESLENAFLLRFAKKERLMILFVKVPT